MKSVFEMPLNMAINAIDKKLEKYDPIWRAENGVGGLAVAFYLFLVLRFVATKAAKSLIAFQRLTDATHYPVIFRAAAA